MAKNVAAGRLTFSGDLAASVAGAEAVFIAVGTPTRRGDGHADLTYVFAAAEEIAKAITGYTVVVTKSTVPVGTNRKVKQIIAKTNPKAEFDVASNPEFLREGAAIDDFMRPDRVIVGVQSDRAGAGDERGLPPALPARFPGRHHRSRKRRDDQIRGQCLSGDQDHLHQRDRGAVRKGRRGCEGGVARASGLDNRIGNKFLHAGPGYGGSCFPKDTSALARIGQEHAVPMQIVETVIKVNDQVKRRMIDKILDLCDGSVKGKTIAVLGVTFKPNTDDMRDAPVADHRARTGRRRRQGARCRSAGAARGRGSVAGRRRGLRMPIRRLRTPMLSCS